MKSIENLSINIKNKAIELGFSGCGFSKADFLTNEAPILEAWLKNNQHGSMQWMANNIDKRLNPKLLHPGTCSIISCIHSYYTPKANQIVEQAPYKISRYALGRDYHKVLKKKLKLLLNYIETEIGTQLNARIFTDSAPIMDKVWAKKAGLGWMGKNTNLINPKLGSYFFIGEILVDIPLAYDNPMKDYCGKCTRCIDACPTQALTPYQINASRCISYYTIENKEEDMPISDPNQLKNWIFGCDICQEVCPWNRFSTETLEPDFYPKPHIADWLLAQKEKEFSETDFKELFMGTPILRTGYKGLIRNIKAVKNP
jgi:epoxyqueuosine reductase